LYKEKSSQTYTHTHSIVSFNNFDKEVFWFLQPANLIFMMRKCCCCISVHVGSFVLGFVGLAVAAIELTVLLPYLLDFQEFNPLQENLPTIRYVGAIPSASPY